MLAFLDGKPETVSLLLKAGSDPHQCQELMGIARQKSMRLQPHICSVGNMQRNRLTQNGKTFISKH